MDQYLIAVLSISAFVLFTGGYYIGLAERKSRRFWVEGGVLVCNGTLKPEDVIALRDLWLNADAELKAGL